MDSSSLIRVVLLAPVYGDYTYSLPSRLIGKVRPGARVVVPFGGRPANGVVVGFAQEAPEGIKIKDIVDLVDDVPILDPRRMALGSWIADYYFAPPGECMRLFMPPGSHVDATFGLHATDEGRARVEALQESAFTFQDKVLSLVMASPGILQKDVARRIDHPGTERTLSLLEKRGLVRREAVVLGARTGFRKMLQVDLTDPDAEPPTCTQRQAVLLEYLKTHQCPMPLTVALRGAGVTHDVARALEKKGIVRILSEESYRDPFCGFGAAELSELVLTPHQRVVVDEVAADIRERRGGRYLLLGVTGSGKTQVYIELIQAALDMGRNALMLVPEISLTPALTRRFLQHFGKDLALLHSMLSDGERHDQWHRIRRKEARVVIGTRSALFAPLEDPGVLILDEEHDSSYKQDETPRYHARAVALRWARANQAALVLGSATPSLESFHAAGRGALKLLELPERILSRPLPRVHVVDMASEFERVGRSVLLSAEVCRALEECLGRGDQAMILLNRRGFSPVLLCRKCGEAVECNHCQISLTYHQGENRLICHYCGYVRTVPPTCPSCGSRYLHYLGTGTEKLEELLRSRFPCCKVGRFDRDTTRRRGSMKEILDRFERREIDLLVGTQMIAKGHDFPGVTLVVVLSTDTALRIPDFRASERAFQLLTQVAGRSGRGENPGEVFIQTYYPEHYAVRLATVQDYARFYARESAFRRRLFYPPFTHLVSVGFRGKSEDGVRRLATRAAFHLQEAIAAAGRKESLRVIGPNPSVLEKIRDEFRWSLLMRCLRMEGLAEVLGGFRTRCQAERLPWGQIRVDVDPLDLT